MKASYWNYRKLAVKAKYRNFRNGCESCSMYQNYIGGSELHEENLESGFESYILELKGWFCKLHTGTIGLVLKATGQGVQQNQFRFETTEINMRKMADQVSRLETGGASNNNRGVDSSNSSSFFFGGMYALRDWYGDSYADPAEMVSHVLKKNHLFS